MWFLGRLASGHNVRVGFSYSEGRFFVADTVPWPGDNVRTAVVTGGGSGIGLAVAERLRKDGYRVATVDLKPPETELAFTADVTDRAQIDAALSGIREQLGPVTVLVNAAGLDGFKRFHHIEFADWQRLIDVNLNGGFH